MNYTVNFNVIGLCGEAGSGKDYIAQFLRKEYDYFPVAFAWNLKHIAIGKQLISYEDAFFNKTPEIRHILQQEGTEKHRDVYGADIWINSLYALMRTINSLNGINKFVISDVRFHNEIEWVSRYGKVFYIDAPNRVNKSTLNSEARSHRSESELRTYPIEKFAGIIHNDYKDENTLSDQFIKFIL